VEFSAEAKLLRCDWLRSRTNAQIRNNRFRDSKIARPAHIILNLEICAWFVQSPMFASEMFLFISASPPLPPASALPQQVEAGNTEAMASRRAAHRPR
jgi:hypothetical protein